MNIKLGNLSIIDIEKRLGIDFPSEIREFMELNHQPEANSVQKGRWHCFDIPFFLVCGDIDIATKIYNSVKSKSSEAKEILQIGVQE